MSTSTPRRPLTFLDGVGVGLGAVTLLPLLSYMLQASELLKMYGDIGDVLHLPVLTRLVLHPAWRFGMPAVVIAAAIAVLVIRPRFRYATILTALLGVLGTGLSYVGSYLPIYALAGSIQ